MNRNALLLKHVFRILPLIFIPYTVTFGEEEVTLMVDKVPRSGLSKDLPESRRPSFSQAEVPPTLARNAVYLELLGQGGFFSINYEYRFHKNISSRIGFSRWKNTIASVDFMGVPLMVNCLIGGQYANLELGAGVLIISAPSTDFFGGRSERTGAITVGTGTLGYRHQSVGGGFVFRAGFTPVIHKGDMFPMFGVSFGHSF